MLIQKFCIFTLLFLVFSGFILMIVLLSLTVNKPVNQNEYAVSYNIYTTKLGPVYSQGKYTLSVGDKLYKFERTLQDFNKDITCLTIDKVLITISSSTQFQYQKESLIPIIMKQFTDDKIYKDFLHNLIISSISNTCSKFTAENYYTERAIIDQQIYSNLITDIDHLDIGTNIQFFQLVNIIFPTTFSQIIQQKQNIGQMELTAINNRESLITNANTELLKAQRTADINIINANNTALIILNKAKIDSEIASNLWQQRGYIYKNILISLNFNHSQLIDYLKSENLRNSEKLLISQ